MPNTENIELSQEIPEPVTSSIVPQGTLLLFANSSTQGGIALTAKNPDGTYTSVGGGAGEKTYNGLVISGSTLKASSGVQLNDLAFQGFSNIISVYNGGKVNRFTGLGDSCSIFISDGGKVSSAVLNARYGGNVTVASGGSVIDVTFMSSGNMTVHGGGFASVIRTSPQTSLTISSGGTATDIIENGAFVSVAQGAEASFVPTTATSLSFGYQSATAHSGTVLNAVSITHEYARVWVYEGGFIENSYVNQGVLFIQNGGSAATVTVMNRGDAQIFISSGAGASAITVSDGGKINTFCWDHTISGITASNGKCKITSNVYLQDRTITVSSGGTMTGVRNYSSGQIKVLSDGIVNSSFLRGTLDNVLYVFSGGTANNTSMTNGTLNISSGGTANNTVNSYGNIYIRDAGAVANNTVLNYSGNLFVSSSGIANATTINSRCSMSMIGGGIASGVVINRQGSMTLYNGAGLTTNAEINSGGLMRVGGGIADSVTVNYAGTLQVEGGTATNIQVSNGGRVEVDIVPNTSAQGTVGGYTFDIQNDASSAYTIYSGVYLTLRPGGVANNVTIESGTSMVIDSYCLATSLTVKSGGSLHVRYSATALNVISSAGAIITSEGGAIVSSGS